MNNHENYDDERADRIFKLFLAVVFVISSIGFGIILFSLLFGKC